MEVIGSQLGDVAEVSHRAMANHGDFPDGTPERVENPLGFGGSECETNWPLLCTSSLLLVPFGA